MAPQSADRSQSSLNPSNSSDSEEIPFEPRIRSEIRLAHPPEAKLRAKDDHQDQEPAKDIPKCYSLENQSSRQSRYYSSVIYMI